MTSLETEVFAAERKWTVEGIPVLTARIAPPHPAVLSRPVPGLSALLRPPAVSPGVGSLPGRPGGQCPPALLPRRAGFLRHLQRKRLLEPVYPVPGAGSRRPDAAAPLGGHLGPADRQPCGHLRLFPAPQRLEKKAAVPGRGGDPQPGGGGLRSVSSWLAAEAPQAFRSPEFLSH